jgi:hypothetical protein
MSQAENRNTTTHSRRALLAGAPSIAAAALAGGTVANAVAIGMAKAGEAGDDAELLALAVEFDPLLEAWRKMSIEQQADLMGFNALLHKKTGLTRGEAHAFDRESPEWQAYRQIMMSCAKEERDPHFYDEQAWEPVRDRFYELAEEILSYEATTREGFALQVRAFTSSYSEVWEDECASGVAEFVECACAFVGVPFPLYSEEDDADLVDRGRA